MLSEARLKNGPQEFGHVSVDEWFPKSTRQHSLLWTSRRVLTKALDFIEFKVSSSQVVESYTQIERESCSHLLFYCTASVLLSNQDVFHGTLTISCLTSTLPELFIKVNLTCDTSMHFIFAEKQICAWHQQSQPVFYIEHDLMPRDPQGPTRQHWAPQTVMYKLI